MIYQNINIKEIDTNIETKSINGSVTKSDFLQVKPQLKEGTYKHYKL